MAGLGRDDYVVVEREAQFPKIRVGLSSDAVPIVALREAVT